jgi:hypothetical protein
MILAQTISTTLPTTWDSPWQFLLVCAFVGITCGFMLHFLVWASFPAKLWRKFVKP